MSKTLISSLLWMICLPLTGITNIPEPIKQAESWLQQKKYSEVIKSLDTVIPGDFRDYALWLKALAYYNNKEEEEALTICRELIREFTQSPWQSKSKFLAAEILLGKKQYREAEQIYQAEAERLLSEKRKEEIAGIYIKFAEKLSYLPKAEELDLPQPDYNKAYQFYNEANKLGISPRLEEEVSFQMARLRELSCNWYEAIGDYTRYLEKYDPDWSRQTGTAGKAQALSGSRERIYTARLHLGEMHLKRGERNQARVVFSNLLEICAANKKYHRLTLRRLPYTYKLPTPENDFDLDNGIEQAQSFLKTYPADSTAPTLAWHIILAFLHRQHTQQAITALQEYLQQNRFQAAAGETAEEIGLREELGILMTPLQQYDTYRMEACFKLGTLFSEQKDYANAITYFSRYITEFPNGPQWTNAQQGIINAEYLVGLDLLAAGKYREAEETWHLFLLQHPLDSRSRQIMFALAQVLYQEAIDLKRQTKTQSVKKFRESISAFQKLVSKYPQTEEASLARLRIAEIQEFELLELEAALATYKSITWGDYFSQAQQRMQQLVNKELVIRTERIFRTTETALVKIQLRNIAKLQISIYRLNLEAYFRKSHSIRGIEKLDLALIQPDRTWEMAVDGYQKYLPLEQQVEIPMEDAGVYAVNIASTELEATTLVIRSDLDIIVKSSRSACLVFAENMVTGQPAAGARVILTDGLKVIAEGATGKDGVFSQKLADLKSAASLNAFVSLGNNSAATGLELANLGFSRGLSPRGYIYTDKPAYKPGETVNIHGILRDVREGSYAVPPASGNGEDYFNLLVTDNRGKTISRERITLSAFGSFNSHVSLASQASLGGYTIRVENKEQLLHFNGSFRVDEYKLEKIRLSLDFDNSLYFRGEVINAVIKAEFYFGQPVAGHELSYRTPDGLQLQGKTDKNGFCEFSFDTTPFNAGSSLNFQASLAGENVSATRTLILASQGFYLTLTANRDVVLEGETVEIKIETRDPAGKPTTEKLEIAILKRITLQQDNLLDAIPWLQSSSRGMTSYTEKPVETRQAATGPDGTTRLAFTPAAGGQYVIRVSGRDRFNNIISGDTHLFASGKADQTKLRLLAEKQHYRVGEKDSITLHSRLTSGALALITFEGEDLIGYRVLEIRQQRNNIALEIDHAHFPNFVISAAVMEENTFHTAALPFTVERELKVTIVSQQRSFEPAVETELELAVSDHTGKPVAAELSLSLVNEALLSLYPDSLPDIVSFFQEGTHREAGLLTDTSCTFTYYPGTTEIIREFLAEQERLQEELRRAPAMPEMETANNEFWEELAVEEEITDNKRSKASKLFSQENMFDDSLLSQTGSGDKRDDFADEEPAEMQERRELPADGYWLGSLLSDAQGKARVKLPLPATTGSFRLQLKGSTADTLVGETAASLTIRKDFFASFKAPATLQEKDKVNFTGRIHNLTDYTGPVKAQLTLQVTGKTIRLPARQIEISANATSEVLFEGYTIPPAAGLTAVFEISAGKYADKLTHTIPIRPWGLPCSAGSSGVSENDTTVLVNLPGGRTYTNHSLKITVLPDIDTSLIDLVLNENRISPLFTEDIHCFPAPPATRLIGAVTLLTNLAAARDNPTHYDSLNSMIKNLISELVSSQHNEGYWQWDLTTREYAVTTSAYWALLLADRAGFPVDPGVLAKTRDYLKDKYSSLAQDDNETKAMLLHALSLSGDADFSFVNRLYRNRNELSDAALAFTALCLAAMSKQDLGREMLEIAGSHGLKTEGLASLYWTGLDNTTWYRNSIETTALLLLAYQEILPGAGEIDGAAAYLMSQRREYGFYPDKVTGLAVAALARYYGRTSIVRNTYAVEVIVNDKSLGSLSSPGREVPPPLLIDVPAALVAAGENRVVFKHSGSGKYGYTVNLSGFSQDLADPGSWTYPRFNYRKYIHEPLTYKGRQLSESSMETGQLEFNRITNVKIDFSSGSRNSFLILEEPVPSGTIVLMDSIKGSHSKVQYADGKLTFFFEPKKYISTISYSLAAYLPGEYQVLPPVLKDALKPAEMRIGQPGSLQVLPPGQASTEEYIMNESELFSFGKAAFEDQDYQAALDYLETLYEKKPDLHQPDVARMLLWIRTESDYFYASRVVEYFEILKEKYPALSIPFTKILTVGSAYHELGEYERAYLVYRATIEASFYKDSGVAGYLEKNGQFIESVEYLAKLLQEYPDLNAVITTWFSIAQEVYDKSANKDLLYTVLPVFDGQQQPRKLSATDLLEISARMLNDFMTNYPEHKLVDDAAFSMLNLSLDKRQYDNTIALSKRYQDVYRESEFFSRYQYMEALAYFSLRRFDDAIATAQLVSGGKSENKDLATYILGQIYHARREPAEAIAYYDKIKAQFSDAGEAIAYFEKKSILIPEVTIYTPGEEVTLNLAYRNIRQAYFQIYKVDLMKLYLREKNLSQITRINLAGIAPFLEETAVLGNGRDYADLEKPISLQLKEEGAYLVVCRGDDIFTSGLILITPLTVEVQEDVISGRIRVNIFDKVRQLYPDNVHIKVIGSENSQFVSGNTDLRGIFAADGIAGYPTVIARYLENQYAFYRSKTSVGSSQPKQQEKGSGPGEQDFDAKYRGNLFEEQKMIQQKNRANLDLLYDQQIEGVEVQMAK